jgi:hypothetical protein
MNNKKQPYTRGLHWPNKEIEGLGVVKKLLESMGINGEKLYNSPVPYKPDPPDCVAKNKNGKLVGFEVTALVDPNEIRENVKGNAVYRDWPAQEIILEIQKRLDEKDKKVFHGGPYVRKIVVLHTHNVVIEQEHPEVIKSHFFEPLSQLQEAYVLLEYQPAIKRYPYIKLKFKETFCQLRCSA